MSFSPQNLHHSFIGLLYCFKVLLEMEASITLMAGSEIPRRLSDLRIRLLQSMSVICGEGGAL